MYILNGQFDAVVDYKSTHEFYKFLSREIYKNDGGKSKELTFSNIKTGYLYSNNYLHNGVIYNAGHSIAINQPIFSYLLIKDILRKRNTYI